MPDGVIKTDHRVHEDHKVWPQVCLFSIFNKYLLVMCTCRRGKVTSGGKTHNADFILIYIPCLCIFSYQLYCALRILQRTNLFIDHRLIIRNPVFKNKCCNTHLIEAPGNIMPLVACCKNSIPSPWTYNYGGTGSLF